MKKSLLFLLCSIFCSCSTPKIDCYNYEIAQKETLIKLYSKIITSGSIEFLCYENGYYRLYVYTYRLDMNNRTPYCTLRSDTLYNKTDLINSGRARNWMTSSMFKQVENHDSYFRCFSEDFLELTNEKKKLVLDSISNRFK